MEKSRKKYCKGFKERAFIRFEISHLGISPVNLKRNFPRTFFREL